MTQSMRTPLGQVRGLGSAKDGVGHFIKQRASAVALIFLVPWLLFNILLIARVGGDAGLRYTAAIEFLTQPLNAVLVLLTIGASLYHMRLGMQVVVEDYIHKHGTKLVLLLLNTFVAIGLFALAAFAILKVAG